MSASYPGSVKSFVTKNPGDTIQTADVNDLQTEVNAIEAGILNGTAAVTSSNLTVQGTATFNGPVVGLSAATPPCVRVTNSAVQQVPSATWTALNWDTNKYDSTGMHSTASNSSRITFKGSSGIYHIGAVVTWSTLASNDQLSLRVMYNGSSVATQTDDNGVGRANPISLAVATDVLVGSSADWISLQVYRAGSTGSIVAESTGAALGFWAHRVSQ